LFIDETWTATNMTRSHGRCAKGERLRMGFPHGHRKTTTLVAGLRTTGMVAPMVLDGPINGDRFEAYVTQVLVPELRRGDVVIMDNLSSHKRASVRERIEAAGATLTGTVRNPCRVMTNCEVFPAPLVRICDTTLWGKG
jgi:transposase